MKPTIRTPYQGSLAKGEVNKFPSLTVPDMSMSVREIIKRHTSGLSMTGIRVPMYDGEVDPTGLDGRDFRTLDLSEKHDLIRLNEENIIRLQQKAYENRIKIEELKKEARKPKPADPNATGPAKLENTPPVVESDPK